MNNDVTIKNGVFRRLKYLVLLQAGEKFRGIKEKPTKKSVFKAFLKVLVAVVVTAVLYLLLSLVRSKFFFVYDKELFTTVIFFDAKISFVTVSPLIVVAVKVGTLFATGDACAVCVALST